MSDSTPAFLTVSQFAATEPALPVGGIRWAIFNAEYNGLERSGALIRLGARVLIDREKYLAWARTNPRLSPPRPKPRPAPTLEARQ